MHAQKAHRPTQMGAVAVVLFAIFLLTVGGAVSAQDPTWVELPLPISNGWLSGLHFVDKSTGWVIGDQGGGEASVPLILHTGDGGETWVEQDGGVEMGALSDVFFTDAQTGYAVGQDSDTGYPLILQTADGGATWSSAAARDVHGYLDCVTFTEDGVGWSSGIEFDNFQSLLLRSEDGVSWTVQPHPARAEARLSAVVFPMSAVGLAVGNMIPLSPESVLEPFLLRTADGGDTWVEITLPVEEGELSDIFFADGSTGWLVGGADEAFILKSTDGGDTWASLEAPPGTMATSVFFISPEEGFVSINRQERDTWNGTLYQTADGGETWTALLGELPGEALVQVQAVEGSIVVYTVGVEKKGGRPVVRRGVVPPPGKQEPVDPTPQPTKDTDGPDDDGDRGSAKLAEIVVTPQNAQLSVGQTQQYTAKGRDTDENTVPIGAVIWSATGGTIDANGMFTATTAGTFAITAAIATSPIAGTALVQVGAPLAIWPLVLIALAIFGLFCFLLWYLLVGRRRSLPPWLLIVMLLLLAVMLGVGVFWLLMDRMLLPPGATNAARELAAIGRWNRQGGDA